MLARGLSDGLSLGVVAILLVVLLLTLTRLPARAIPAREVPDLTTAHAPTEILVKWRTLPGQTATEMAVERAQWRDKISAKLLDTVPALGIERWRIPPGRMEESLHALLASPSVAWAEPNYLLSLPDESPTPIELPEVQTGIEISPNDPGYNQYARQYLARIGVESAWSITTGDPRIIVAVVDTGVDCTHEDLVGRCWINEDEIPDNGVDDDGNGYVDDRAGWSFYKDSGDVGDVMRHGTHVTGIIAATMNNGKGIAGVAPSVTIMPVAVFTPVGVGTYYDLIRGILYAVDNGARVINLSLGATTYSRGEAEAVQYAEQHGVVVVAAAGNQASNRLFYPAAHPQTIAVAATDANDGVAGFSNYGTYVDVAAPGVSILSTIPGNGYGILSGTSMATPHVAGLAALILSLNPSLTPAQVRDLITRYASDQVGPPNLDPPGWDPHYGYGRIHIGNTVAATPGGGSFPPSSPSGEAPQLPWTPACEEVVVNGGFEDGLDGWTVEQGELVTSPVYAGQRALRLASERNARAEQSLTLPAHTLRATFFAALRIESADGGDGPSPTQPFDDWLRIDLASPNGEAKTNLLFAGNTSDDVAIGLAWDEIVAILSPDDLPTRSGEVRLVFETGSDGDYLKTAFIVDDVRVCVVQGQPRSFLPFVPNSYSKGR